MELGGKDVCIVCEDADLDLAAKNIVKGGFSYSGQRCTAVKLVLALESIADELVAKVKKGVDALSVGAPEVGLQTSLSSYCDETAYSTKLRAHRQLNFGGKHRALGPFSHWFSMNGS